MKVPFNTRRRRAISGIIGAVFLFTMLFTVGSEYFIFINNANAVETQSLVARGNALAARLQEDVQVSTSVNSTGYIQFYLNNTGGATVNVTSLVILNVTGAVLGCYGVGLPSTQGCRNTTPGLPAVANPGVGTPSTGYVVTNYQYAKGTVVLKLITSTGNIFTATYPQTSVSLAAQALSSGAIGDLYLDFQSYSFYTVALCTGSSVNYCITYQGKGFAVPISDLSGNVAFSVSVTDLNPQQANITLDEYSFIADYAPKGNSFLNAVWYVVDNSSSQIMNSYTPIVLTYDKPKTLVFASGSYGAFSPTNGGWSALPKSGTLAAVNLISHGWEGDSYSAITGDSPPPYNYGQNSPYVSVLYY